MFNSLDLQWFSIKCTSYANLLIKSFQRLEINPHVTATYGKKGLWCLDIDDIQSYIFTKPIVCLMQTLIDWRTLLALHCRLLYVFLLAVIRGSLARQPPSATILALRESKNGRTPACGIMWYVWASFRCPGKLKKH